MVQKRNNIKNQRKISNLRMAEDFLDNIRLKTREIIDFCEVPADIDQILPQNDTKEDKVNTYQNILLYLEIIYQHIDNLTIKNQKLTDRVFIQQSKNKNLESLLEKTQEKCSFLNNKLEITRKDLEKKNERMKRMKKQCECLEEVFKENVILKEENNILKMNIEDIEEDYQQEKISLEEITKISDENLYLNNKIDILDDENKHLKEKVKILETNSFKNKSLENLIKKMKHTIKQRTKELDNKNNELNVLKEKINNQKQGNDEMNKKTINYYEESVLFKSNVYKSKITNHKNLLSPSFIASLQEVYNKMEDIDNFIFGMMEKENNPSKNVFKKEDIYLDVVNKVKTSM